MRASIVRPRELGPGELAAWQAMQKSHSEFTNPFLSPAFTLAVGRTRAAARVAVLQDGNEVVGFFPFEQGPFRTARPIGAGVSDAEAVVHAPGLDWDARELLKACRLDVWEFDHLAEGQIERTARSVARHSSPIIDLSNGYEAYMAERRSRKTFKSTLYKQRKLEREVGAVRFEFDARDPSALGLLMRWKSAQYRRTGRRDRFATGWIERLVWDLFESRSGGCTGILSVLYSDGEVVAAHFGPRSEGCLACWFPAYDPGLARYSPGLSLHLMMAEAAAASGIGYLDLGKGDEPYKQSLKTGDLTVGEGWIRRRSVGAVVHGVRRTPGRFASKVILSHPRLRRAARRTLKQVGSLRSPG
jgi:CelD/BcsL family acetyltransferase involved in cellulose biosynthesis